MTKMNYSKFILAIFLFFWGILQFKLFNIDIIDSYANFNLYYNYDYGIFKRALPGQIYSWFNQLSQTDITRQDYIGYIHNILLYLFLVGVVLCFIIVTHKNKANTFLAFVATFALLSSYFFKNLIALKGYLDIYVFCCLVWIMVFSLLRCHIFAFVIACICSFIHEEILFFYLPFLLSELVCNQIKFKKTFLLATVFTVTTLYVTFSKITPEAFYNFFENRHSPEIEMLLQQFTEQHESIFKLISGRITEILGSFDNFIFAHIFLTLPSFILFFIVIRFMLKQGVCTLTVALTILLSAFVPISINFLAIDLWRIVAFLCFSFWLELFLVLSTCSLSNLNNTDNTVNDADAVSHKEKPSCIIRNACIFILFLATINVMMPNINISLNDTFWVGGKLNSDNYNKYLRGTLPYNLVEEFADFYLFRNGDKDNIVVINKIETDGVCHKNGNQYPIPQFSYGRKIMIIRASNIPDSGNFPSVKFGPYVWEIKPDIDNIFPFEIPREVILAGNYTLFFECYPYKNDWNMTLIKILDANSTNSNESKL
jgi:hypothetical protein